MKLENMNENAFIKYLTNLEIFEILVRLLRCLKKICGRFINLIQTLLKCTYVF